MLLSSPEKETKTKPNQKLHTIQRQWCEWIACVPSDMARPFRYGHLQKPSYEQGHHWLEVNFTCLCSECKQCGTWWSPVDNSCLYYQDAVKQVQICTPYKTPGQLSVSATYTILAVALSGTVDQHTLFKFKVMKNLCWWLKLNVI